MSHDTASSGWLRSNVGVTRVAALVAVVLSIGGLATALTVVLLEGSGFDLIVEDFQLQLAAIGVGFGLLAWFVLPREPENRVVWVYALVAVLAALFVAAEAVAVTGLRAEGMPITTDTINRLRPADLNFMTAAAIMTGATVISPAIFWLLSLGVLMFPDGRLPSPRWRWVVWLAVASGITTSAILAYLERPGGTVTYGTIENSNTYDDVITAPLLGLAIATIASFLALFIRFRRSTGAARQQIRWVLFGAALAGSALAAAVLMSGIENQLFVSLLVLVPLLIFMGCFWVALTRYRVYDIDVVISKTVVYGALAVFIGVVYVAIVVGVGAAFGGGSDANPVLAIVATALVAVAFQPLRALLDKLANRLVYGKKATPYEVLSEFSRQVAATDESLLEPVARFLAEGTTATGAAVWTLDDGHLRQLSAWPETEAPQKPIVVTGGSPIEVAGADAVLPITHGGDLMGALSLSTAPGQELHQPDLALAEELTAGMGLALRNLQLTRDLEDRVEELRESRRRIVAVQDETRRRLERDLHDGAQQRLVALKVKLALAGQMANRDGASRTVEFLGDLSAQADEAVAVLREFARGVYPPLLEAEGLRAAVRSAANRLPITVDVAAEGAGRYAKELEATVYFCVLEALQNVVKFARATSAQVTLHDEIGNLRFEVRDAGVGFNPAETPKGGGLLNMTDRVDAAGGTLTIDSSPGAGTVVIGTLPTGSVA
jgi:signal transduction histidine kinase